MKKSVLTIFIIVLAIVLGTSCTWGKFVTQKGGEFNVSLTFNPDPPKIGKNTLAIVISDSKGKLLSGAKVSLSFSMPGMGMEMGKAKAKEISPGTYQAATTFGMAGDWAVKLTITPKGGKKTMMTVFFKV